MIGPMSFRQTPKSRSFAIIAITGAVALLMQYSDVELGSENYWDHRGVFFLFFVTLFPRLTLLFSSVALGGVFWWLGFIFVPRILVAVLATLAYWDANPILVLISWLVALSGESSEKYLIRDRVRIVGVGGAQSRTGTTIEGEYRRIDE